MHMVGGMYLLEETALVAHGRIPTVASNLDMNIRLGVSGSYEVWLDPSVDGVDGVQSSNRSAGHLLGGLIRASKRNQRKRNRKGGLPYVSRRNTKKSKVPPMAFIQTDISSKKRPPRPTDNTKTLREQIAQSNNEPFRARVLKGNIKARGGTVIHVIDRVLLV